MTVSLPEERKGNNRRGWEAVCIDSLLGNKRVIPPLTDISDEGFLTPELVAQVRGMLAYDGSPTSTGKICAVPFTLHKAGDSIDIELHAFTSTGLEKAATTRTIHLQRIEDTEMDIPPGETPHLVAYVDTMKPIVLNGKKIVASTQYIFGVNTTVTQDTEAWEDVHVPLFVAVPVSGGVVANELAPHSSVICFLYPPDAVSVTLNQNASKLINPKGTTSAQTSRRL